MQIVLTFWNQAPSDFMSSKLTREQLRDVPCGYWLAAARDAGFLSYTEAIKKLDLGANPSDFALVSEERSIHAEILLARGCTAHIVYSMESPLYRPTFYDDSEWRSRFKIDWSPMPFYPSENYDMIAPAPRERRRNRMCAFASAKHWSELPGPWDSMTYARSFHLQLLQTRWMRFYDEAKRGGFHLYGSGWDIPRSLPAIPADFFDVISASLRPSSPYSEKFTTMLRYDSVLSIENWSGYATEKAFDAQAVGVQNIYIGHHAPKMDSIIDRISSTA